MVNKFAPDALPQRKGAKHTHFVSSGNVPTTLDGVQVHLSPTEREHLFSAPNEEGPEFRRLRRFGLLLSRYGLVDKNRFVKRKGFSHDLATTAERIVAMEAYKKVFGGDPTIGVANVQPLVTLLNTPNPSRGILTAALGYSGTKAGEDILAGITNEETRDYVREGMERVASYADHYARGVMEHINKSGRSSARWANRYYEMLCDIITDSTSRVERKYIGRKAQQDRQMREALKPSTKGSLSRRTEAQMYGNRLKRGGKPIVREIVPSLDGWAHALLEKLPLTLPHTGRKGRKLIPMPYGKSIRFIVREDTDPEQRVFARKTRATGGIVVVDCSGSMSFGVEDLDRIMAATAGATVLCYSSGRESEGGANIWLVAKGGRRTSVLPDFPGNNGVDGPALEYGLSLRRHNEPVVWISDTQVTGAGDICSNLLRDWCLDFCHKHGIHITRNSHTAASLLRKLQLGQKPTPTNYKLIRER